MYKLNKEKPVYLRIQERIMLDMEKIWKTMKKNQKVVKKL